MKNQILQALTALVAQEAFVNAFEAASIDEASFDVVFEAPIKTLTKDGLEASRSDIFKSALIRREEHASKLNADKENHPLLEAPDSFDVDMSLELDFNHVIELKMKRATEAITVIPDLHLGHFMLVHPNCENCTVQHGAHWAPDSHEPASEKEMKGTFDYFYLMHASEAQLTGRLWNTGVCFNTYDDACAEEYQVFSIEKADPWFHSLGDGYFGLAPSALDDMTRQGMISKPLMGVHTKMTNSTEDASHIRFGGVNTDLQGPNQAWLSTLDDKSWDMEMSEMSFHGDTLFTDGKVLINPGFPFIGVPKDDYEAFKKDVTEAYPDEAVTCTDIDWCYFVQSCDAIKEKMPDISFSFKGSDGASQTIKVPPTSFLFDMHNHKDGLDYCHMGVVGLIYSKTDTWILGQAFMENFYVTFDATTPSELRVGLNWGTPVPANGQSATDGGSSSGSALLITLIIVGALAIIGVAAFFGFRVIYKRKQAAKLEKAKTYFESLKTEEKSEDKSINEQEDVEASADPNTFC